MSDGSDILSEETKQYLAKKGIRPRSSVTRYFRAATTWFLGDNIYKSSIIDFDLQRKDKLLPDPESFVTSNIY